MKNVIQRLTLGLLLAISNLVVITPGASADGAMDFKSGLKDAQGVASKAGLNISTNVNDVILTALKFGLGFVSIIAVAALCYGGYLYITALGDEKKVGGAKQIIKFSLIGLAIIILSALLVNTVITLLKG